MGCAYPEEVYFRDPSIFDVVSKSISIYFGLVTQKETKELSRIPRVALPPRGGGGDRRRGRPWGRGTPSWGAFRKRSPRLDSPSRSSWGEVGWRERRRAPSPQGGRGVGRHDGPPSGEGGIVGWAMANLALELGVADFRILDALEEP
jgi:hypothetical protein